MRRLRTAPAGAAKFFLVPEGRGVLHTPPPDGPGRGRMFVPGLPNLSTFAAGLCRSREVWLRYTVYQPQACLQSLVEVFASVKHACRAPSKCSPASSRLAGPCRSVRQRQAGLQGPVEVFASVKQACRAPSKCSPASSRLAGPRRSVRQLQAGLQDPVEVFASSKQACRAPSKCSPAPKQTGISPIDTVRPIRYIHLTMMIS